MVHIGKKIDTLRKLKQIPVSAIAEKLDLTRDAVYKMFPVSDPEMAVSKLLIICEMLGISPNELFEWKGSLKENGDNPDNEYPNQFLEDRLKMLEQQVKEIKGQYQVSKKKKSSN